MKSALLFISRWCLPFILALATLAIYLPGLAGDFEFDDATNILDNAAIKIDTLTSNSIWAAALSGKSGPLSRSISMLTFAGNYYFTGFDPFFFKLTNVLIHILAGLCVYAFVRQITLAMGNADDRHQLLQANAIAVTVMGVWLVHPLNLTSVLYVVQRMTSLSALFTFWALTLYVCGRRQTLQGNQAKGLCLILIALGPVTALAVLSKENGVLAPYLMLMIELIVFRFAASHKSTRQMLYIIFCALVLVPVLLLILNSERFISTVLGGYIQRDFSLSERLLTQPRVLIFYLRLLLSPNAGLMGIYHDDFPISSSLIQPFTTLLSIVAIACLIAVGVFSSRRAPALAIGILFFFMGHSIESTFLSLEMMHEHRNYLPIIGPIFAASYYFWHSNFSVLANRAKWIILTTVLLTFSAVTYVRSVQWSNVVDHAAIEAYNHPDSERANYSMGRIYFLIYANEPKVETAKLANQYFARAVASGSSSIFALTAMIQMAYKARVAPDPVLTDRTIQRLQFGRPWAPNMVALNNLVNCQMSQYCRLADSDMAALLLAALANPRAAPSMKGTAHSLLGGYYAMKLQNLELGIPHLKAATESDPDHIEYRLDLMRLYEATNNLVAARAELEAARGLDKWGLQTARLDSEKALLDSAFKAQSN